MNDLSDRELNLMNQSELLRVAVEHGRVYDELVKADPEKFKWDMNTWISQTDGGVCWACLAGAVLYSRDRRRTFADTPPYWCHDINRLRVGEFDTGDADGELVKTVDSLLDQPENVEHYRQHGRFSWETYTEFADILEKAGL